MKELKFLKWKKDGKFESSSGKELNSYYDLKEMLGDPKILNEEARRIAHSTSLDVDVIIGIDYGGTPLAIALSLITGIPYGIIRKKEKEHGTRKRIEGSPIKGKCLLLDDVRTTGKGMADARYYLEEHGYTITDTIVLLDRDLDLNTGK